MTTKECKMSKQGWPLGKYAHRIAFCRVGISKPLINALTRHYGGEFRFEAETVDADGGFGNVIIETRMSMDRYGQISAFARGYLAAQY